MATSTTISNFDPALKQIYRQSNVEKTTYKRRPLLGMLPKFEGFGGRNMPVVSLFGNPQGRSAAFATAQANATQVKVEDFLLTRVNNYSVATITGETVEATRGDNMAFLQALKTVIDTAMASLADDLETALFRGVEGWRAQIAAPGTESAMILTLLQTEEIPNFEVGMVIVADDTAAGSSLRTTPATATIANVNRSAGTITTGYDNSGSATNWAASDYLFVQGDASAKMSGLRSWFPPTAPGSTAFFGVDRSVDGRLYGTIHSGAAQPVEEAGIDAQSKVAREGGAPDCWLMHHVQMRRLIKELGSKKEYNSTSARGAKGLVADVGYEGVVVLGDHGPIKCIAANKSEARYSYLLQMDSNQLASLGPNVKFLMEDGLRILRQASADGYEVRLGFRGNFASKAPIWNANVLLPSP